ncbi:MAG TPA: phytanoyl-CoA dioxygenase family protein [Gemmatimonadaceae bacterium]|nr:phytanoyl-CoA dioxygenase family protein [Gemmatimonadaceae bacterium]
MASVSAPPTTKLRRAAHHYSSRMAGELTNAYLGVRHRWRWTVTRNPASERLFRAAPPAMTADRRRIAESLAATGIAVTSADEIGLPDAPRRALDDMLAEFVASERVQSVLHLDAESAARRLRKGDDYMVKRFPEPPTLAASNPLLRVGLDAAVLDPVNSYLRLWARLTYTDLWHTIPVDVGRRIGSQQWHRDPEDLEMVKVYYYHTAVTEDSGPLEYVRESHAHGRFGKLWGWHPTVTHGDRYPNEEQLDRAVPREQRVLATGPAGTIVFCDTSGLHRGGISRGAPRIVATWTFVTPASIGVSAWRRFTVEDDGTLSSYSAAARTALV